MLKHYFSDGTKLKITQPPLGGCVLKLEFPERGDGAWVPAAFRRLCVETSIETAEEFVRLFQPPLGGCVLKPICDPNNEGDKSSRL